MHSVVRIYVLAEPDTRVIRYVGATTVAPCDRLRGHLREARRSASRCHRLEWLRSLHSPPVVWTLETCVDATWEEREKFWIRFLRACGYDLVNTAKGGGGAARPLTQEQRDKIPKFDSSKRAETVSNVLRGRISPTRGKTQSVEQRTKRTASLREFNEKHPRHRFYDNKVLPDPIVAELRNRLDEETRTPLQTYVAALRLNGWTLGAISSASGYPKTTVRAWSTAKNVDHLPVSNLAANLPLPKLKDDL